MLPELPEVETFKRYFDSTALNHVIKEIYIKDDRVLNLNPKSFKEFIIGKKFSSSRRHGKYLFVDLNPAILVFHFGMTGDLDYFNEIDDEPIHTRVLFQFENNHYLSYISQRMFGRLDLTDKIESFLQEKNLGPDAFKMSFEDFKLALKRRSAYAKSALMDQSLIAGIGNIYSDEILFQSQIHPKTKINMLSDSKLEQLFNTIKKVLQYGIDKKGELSAYSDDFLIPHREKEGNCPTCHAKIQRLELSGRHGFFCPKCQVQLT
ncbi:MAG: formamidopyrimidine-DNA glycosylase [Promethearchaeota archaeon]|nr:MAG: formamidopyrimidine-DNA glycosylase [Candidatus Lokiarchaeota archaeon]